MEVTALPAIAKPNRVSDLVDKAATFWTTAHGLIGLSLWRLSTGSCLTYWYLSHYWNRHYLWGPDGVIPHSDFRQQVQLSLYALSPSPAYFELVFHLGIVVAVLFALGWRTRITAPVNLVFHYSLYIRNNYFPNAGDNLIVIVQLLLLFANTGAYFSLDAERRHHRMRRALLGQQVLAAIHNTVLAAAILQLTTVYMIAGMHKITGEMWNSGTALYYVLRVAEYSFPPYTDWLVRNTYLIVFSAYAIILFQIGFGFSLFNRVTRFLWIAAGFAFHAGIAIFMGLITFGWFFMSVYALLITDGEYQTIARRVRAWLDGKRLQVFYDGWCPICVRSMRMWQALDTFTLLEFRSFRDADVMPQLPAEMTALERRIHVRSKAGDTVTSGLDAIVQIASRIAWLWPLVPVLCTLRYLRLGDLAYDWLANHRFHFLAPSRCQTRACHLDRSPS